MSFVFVTPTAAAAAHCSTACIHHHHDPAQLKLEKKKPSAYAQHLPWHTHTSVIMRSHVLFTIAAGILHIVARPTRVGQNHLLEGVREPIARLQQIAGVLVNDNPAALHVSSVVRAVFVARKHPAGFLTVFAVNMLSNTLIPCVSFSCRSLGRFCTMDTAKTNLWWNALQHLWTR